MMDYLYTLKKLNSDYPQKYIELINRVVNSMTSIFDDNLITIILGGSGGKGNIIDGWSDIDLYVILRTYDVYEISNITKLISKEKIHVGVTYYLRDEVINNIIDVKTKIMLYEKQTYKVNPTLYGNDTIFNKISYREVKQNDKNSFPVVLHDIRRRYMNLYIDKNEKLEKTYIKKLLVLIKCILNYYDIFSYGYDKTFTKFKLLCDLKYGELTNIYDFNIMKVINNVNNSKDEVLNFSYELFKLIEKNLIYEGEL